jgi:hypothetical protein
MAPMSVDEQIEKEALERERRERLQIQTQQDRLAEQDRLQDEEQRGHDRVSRLKESAKQQIEDKAKRMLKRELVGVAKRVGARAILMNPWVWGAVAFVVGILLLISFAIAVPFFLCNDDGWGATAVRWIYWFRSKEICSHFTIADGSNVSPNPLPPRPIPVTLVQITGVPVDPNLSLYRARLRQCMLDKLQQLYIAPPIEWVVTSAYRPESDGSFHQTGEAFDIALRNPTVGFFSNDPRIATLIGMARGIGFTPPAGDVIDEYNRPSRHTEGAHIHVEFNYDSANNRSYCDS